MINGVFLLLGGNLGDRRNNLRMAENLIDLEIGKISSKSKIYETAAWGKEEQPEFLNQVLSLSTELTPNLLLEGLHAIEKKLDRTRHEHWGARTIDIDILYYGNIILDQPKLKIPHPEIVSRKFTLVPLAEIAPNFINPILLKTNIELLNTCRDHLEVKLFKELPISIN